MIWYDSWFRYIIYIIYDNDLMIWWWYDIMLFDASWFMIWFKEMIFMIYDIMDVVFRETSLLSSISHTPLWECHVSVLQRHAGPSASTCDDQWEGCIYKPYLGVMIYHRSVTVSLVIIWLIWGIWCQPSPLETHDVRRPQVLPWYCVQGFLLLICFPL